MDDRNKNISLRQMRNCKGRARSGFSFCLKMQSYKICGQVWGKYVENCVENVDNRNERVSSIINVVFSQRFRKEVKWKGRYKNITKKVEKRKKEKIFNKLLFLVMLCVIVLRVECGYHEKDGDDSRRGVEEP